MNEETLKELRKITDSHFYCYTGSRFICNPPVMDTDINVVVLPVNVNDYYLKLINWGYKPCSGGQYENDTFIALRKDDINVILVSDYSVFESWQLATAWATRLNIKNKAKRIEFFSLVKEQYLKDKKVNMLNLERE